MMPKTILIAPAGVGGQIHASSSGKNYNIAANGAVVVDAVDVGSLLNGGFRHLLPKAEERERAPDAPPIASVATASHHVGASAIDPERREDFHRGSPETTVQENHDFGDATPPHGVPQPGTPTDTSRADAEAEIDVAQRAGTDPEHRSQVPDTGHMESRSATGADQDAVRDGERGDSASSVDHRD